MKKTNYFLITIGLILIIIPFFINIYSIYKLISVLIGIIVLSIGLIIYRHKVVLKVCFFPIMIIFGVLIIDFVSAMYLKRIPIISIQMSSSSKVKTYNSFLYRVFDCNKVLTPDYGYQKNYVCLPNDIEAMTVSKLLENPKESYKKYLGKFVHLKGKLNTIKGENTLQFNSFTGEVELNGYVTFDINKKVIIEKIAINPDDYHVYDIVEFIGEVTSYKEESGTFTLYINNAQIIQNDLYKKYELLVNNIDNKEKVQVEENIYYLGIEGIYYKYDTNNIYKLNYLLLDKRETIDNLTKDIDPETINEKDKVYKLEEYNIVKCKNKKIIFVNKKVKISEEICE